MYHAVQASMGVAGQVAMPDFFNILAMEDST